MTIAVAVVETTGLVEAKLKTKSRFPITKLDHLVKNRKTSPWKRSRDLPCFLPIRGSKMIAFFLGAFLKGEIVQTARAEPDLAGQQARLKVLVSIRDYNGHIELGVKCSKDKAFTVIPAWRAY